MYRRFGIKPIFVFDGASVPVKLKSIKERRLSEREGKRKEGEDLMRTGKVKEANLKFKDSVDINPYHVYKLIQVITHLVDSNQWTKAYPKLEDYKRKYKMAVHTYKHQRIYNMHAEKIDYLTTPPEDLLVENDKLAFLGPFIPKDIVQGIAKGKLNPKTQKPLYDGGRGCGTNKRIHEEHTDVYSGRDHEPDPFSQKNTTCNYFTSGNCYKGTKCRYSHEEHTNVYSGRDHRPDPLSQKNTACKYFTSGNCREGTNCRYSHKGEALDRPEGRSADWRGHNLGNQNFSHRSNRSADQCIDFLNGQCERGSSCRYVHDDYVPDGSRHDTHKNNKTPCMFYASGRCRFGIRCIFSHAVEDLDGPKGRQDLNLGNENNSRGARKRGSEDFMPGFHVRKK